MALFLSEAVNNYERKQVTRGSTDLTEAALMLLNISEQSASLTEAVMTAEFTLMRQCRNLSEGETSNKMKDFGKKVWHNLKAFAKTVWAKIKEICRMVWRKLKEWGSQVLDMFSGKEMEIHKEGMKFLEDAPRLMEKMLFLIEKGLTASEDAADDFKDKVTDLKKDWEDLTKEIEKERVKAGVGINPETKGANNKVTPASYNDSGRDEKKGYVRVGKNWLKSVTNSIKNLATRLEKYTDDAEKRLEQLEKIEGRMSHEDNQKDMGKAAQAYQAGITLAKEVAAGITKAAKEITSIGRSVGKNEMNEESAKKKVTSLLNEIKGSAGAKTDDDALYNDAKVTALFNSDSIKLDITHYVIDGTTTPTQKQTISLKIDKINDILESIRGMRTGRKEMKKTFDAFRD